MKEVERKFLLNEPLPAYGATQIGENKFIEQWYVVKDGTLEGRIRAVRVGQEEVPRFYFTLKLGNKSENSALVRDEYEFEITKSGFEDLLQKCQYQKPVYKMRREYKLLSGHVATVDVFLEGFEPTLLEIEFPTEKEADEYTVPDFLGKEVTKDPYYKNYNIYLLVNGDDASVDKHSN